MRKWILLIVLVVVLMRTMQGVQGQNMSPGSIAIYADSEIDRLGLKTSIEDNLLNYEIKVIWVKDLHSAAIGLYFHYQPVNHMRLVYVGHRDAPDVSLPSPVLEFSAANLSVPYNLERPGGMLALTDYVTGLALFSSAQYEPAISSFERVLELSAFSSYSPGNFANFYLGMCLLLESNDYTSSAYYLEKSLQGSRDSEGQFDMNGAAVNLAWIYLQLGEEVMAVKRISQYVEIRSRRIMDLSQPRHSEVVGRTKRAEFYALASRYDDAVTDLTAAIEIEPENPELYTMRGQMYLYLYEWDSVLADYNTAIELDPAYADAYFFRGILYYSILQTGQELRPEALADFQYYLELAPDGTHAAEAARYAATIQAELDALDGE